MFVTLGQLAEAQGVSSVWVDQVTALVASADAKQWPALVVSATDLVAKANKGRVVPVATTVSRVQAAAKALADGKGKPEDLEEALKVMVAVAQREDLSTVPDRIRNEEVLDKRLDEFERGYAEWQKAHSGFMAIWDKLRGGPDLSPFQATLDDLKGKIDVVPLTIEGRQRLLERHSRLVTGLKPGDWKILVATGVGALALNAIVSKGGSLAASGASVVAAKAKTRYGKKSSEKKPKKSKKRKRAKSDED